MILLSMIDDNETKQFDMVKAILEHIKPYMNLDLYRYEKGEDKKDESIKNVAFEHQSKVGRATGIAQSPKWVRDALKHHFAEIEKRKPKKVVWSDDPSILG
jgi:hypothetical protein